MLNESDVNTLLDKRDKLKIQLDDAKHSLQSHIKMKRFNEDDVKWSEKYEALKLKIDNITNNIKTNEDQIKLARLKTKNENKKIKTFRQFLYETKLKK